MTDLVDCRQEAKECLHLAQIETDPDIRTILMGMALGWLRFATEIESESAARDESKDELV